MDQNKMSVLSTVLSAHVDNGVMIPTGLLNGQKHCMLNKVVK